MIAVFTVPYGPEAKSTSRPDTLEMATIDGASLFSKYGIDAVTRRTVPIRSTSNDSTQFSGVSGIASALTLLTTISMPPNNFAESSTHLDIASASLTSITVPTTVLPLLARAASVAATSPASRAQKATLAPSATNVSTMARPIPLVPPVTNTVLPFICRSMIFSSQSSAKWFASGKMSFSKHLIDQEGECQVDHQRTGENTFIAAEQCKFCTPGELQPQRPKEDDREDQDDRQHPWCDCRCNHETESEQRTGTGKVAEVRLASQEKAPLSFPMSENALNRRCALAERVGIGRAHV